jgi:hypothetical protein
MFEEGYGILLSVGIQKETSREGSSRHEEIRDAQGNVLETYQHDDAQPKETETRYQPVMAIQVPIKIAEEIFQPRDGLWLIPSAGVGCDPSFDRCDLQGSLSVGYTPSSTEE